MASYLWAPDSAHLLFDTNGSLWLYDLKTGTGLNIGVSGEGSGDDPKFSPDGKLLSFINEHGEQHGLSVIHLRDVGRQSTVLPAQTIRPFSTARWIGFTKKSSMFAVTTSGRPIRLKILLICRWMNRSVPEYPITDWIPVHPTTDRQRYPHPAIPIPMCAWELWRQRRQDGLDQAPRERCVQAG
jgi:dipeptidyl-peptidase-4